jgi:hypothetical protein
MTATKTITTRRTAPKPKPPKTTTASTTKRTKVQHQKGMQQQKVTAAPAGPEPAPEATPETAAQSGTQGITNAVDELIAQRGIEPQTQASGATGVVNTRPSTPEPVETATPTAPTIVRAKHHELEQIPQGNLQRRGRGRPPKSKSSNNDEKQQEASTSSIEAALTITRSETRADPPTTIDTRVLQSSQLAVFTEGGGVPVPRTIARARSVCATTAAKRRRERSQDVSDDNQLPSPPAISMNLEPNNVVLSSAPSYRELHTEQVLESDSNGLLQNFIESSARLREYDSIRREEDDRISIQSSITRSSPDALI